MPSRLRRTLLAAALPALLLLAGAPPIAAAQPIRVAIIVGPVGEELTPQYLQLAELAASTAEVARAEVRRAYSPDATPERVAAAVQGANIIVYLGHGTGFPNPYGPVLNPASQNGWALQGPNADGTHADTLADGRMRYYGEAWLEANVHPAPGFVMIYSNACYAPGASEGGLPRPDQAEAAEHVANYSRPMLAMGASGYFATDFYGGASVLIGAMLASPELALGDVFRSEPHFQAAALTRLPHPTIEGAEVWLHRSAYFQGQEDYWYAFAGDPARSLSGSATSGWGPDLPPAPQPANVVTGRASSYAFTPGFEQVPTVALPVALGGRDTLAVNGWVAVCGDRCAVLPVVDSCPCYWGTQDQRVVNLSLSAWDLISDVPLAEGLIPVRIYLDGKVPAGERATPMVLKTDGLGPPVAAPAVTTSESTQPGGQGWSVSRSRLAEATASP